LRVHSNALPLLSLASSALLGGDKSPVVASNAYYALPLFKRESISFLLLLLKRRWIQKLVFEDGGV